MRPLVAEINLDTLRQNYTLACSCSGSSKSFAVVKANAYGHGAVECVRSLEDTASAFAVASIEEALSLRIVGIRSPILLLEGIFEASELELVDKYDLWLAVHTAWQVEALLSYTPLKPFSIWLKVDSGLHRLGFTPTRAVQIWNKLERAKQVGSLHLMSHFATADAISVQFFNYQTLVMQSLRDYLGASLSLANSAALMSNTDNLGEWNRPGIMLYGSDPLEQASQISNELQPVMTLRSRVIAMREIEAGASVGYGGRWKASKRARIAVVAGGYGDGYDRHAVNGTPVLIQGKRAPVIGRVSMDMITVDISHLDDVYIGSEAVLWGRASCGAYLSVDEVARYCNTISYTLLTGVMPRVPRKYISSKS